MNIEKARKIIGKTEYFRSYFRKDIVDAINWVLDTYPNCDNSICSKHLYHESGCKLCEAITVAELIIIDKRGETMKDTNIREKLKKESARLESLKKSIDAVLAEPIEESEPSDVSITLVGNPEWLQKLQELHELHEELVAEAIVK